MVSSSHYLSEDQCAHVIYDNRCSAADFETEGLLGQDRHRMPELPSGPETRLPDRLHRGGIEVRAARALRDRETARRTVRADEETHARRALVALAQARVRVDGAQGI